MALAWCFHRQEINSVIIGTSSVKQLEDNLEAMKSCTFTDEELWLIGEQG
jgi:L-glyceraldehyde 3-phosphate reductase